jgi:hypothetical protein
MTPANRPLTEVEKEIVLGNRNHRLVVAALWTARERMFYCGLHYGRAKAQAGHGHWERTFARIGEVSMRTAQRYMLVADVALAEAAEARPELRGRDLEAFAARKLVLKSTVEWNSVCRELGLFPKWGGYDADAYAKRRDQKRLGNGGEQLTFNLGNAMATLELLEPLAHADSILEIPEGEEEEAALEAVEKRLESLLEGIRARRANREAISA